MARPLLLFILLIVTEAAVDKKKEREEKCSGNKTYCKAGVMLPIWEPQVGISTGDVVSRAVVYLLALCYVFLGVSIIADRFMAAIEVITSKERELKVKKVTGETYTVLVRVWNETVSNLTLMALGSSAPEILLSIIEIVGNNFNAGQLGPGTIVGSAAFNLFIIVGICVIAIPRGEIRRIKHIYVFWVTVIWSIFAYVWLLLILSVISPGVVTWWEALLTFLFFPLTVLTAYIADRKMFGFGRRYFGAGPTSFSRPGSAARESRKGAVPIKGSDGETEAFEEHRTMYIEVFKRLRAEHPDAPISTLEDMAQQEIMKKGPKSRAYYRIQATRKLIGGGNIASEKARRRALDGRKSAASDVTANGVAISPEDDGAVKVNFDPGHYTCMEDVGTVYLTVVCDRGGVSSPCVVQVDYKTEDGTANAKDDYLPVQGTLVFYPNEFRKNIGVAIVDNDIYEADEHFYVHLSNVRLSAVDAGREPGVTFSGPGLKNMTAKLGTPASATVMIVDNDHSGCFSFEQAKYEVAESAGEIRIKVMRSRGARGPVSVPFKTVDGSAKANHDYRPVVGSLEFSDEQTEALIAVEIFNDDQYEKSEDFFIQMDDPKWTRPKGAKNIEEEKLADEGRPVLGEVARCKVIIKESKEFKGFVDKMLASANTTLVVGTSSWKQQFIEALTVEGGGEDDSTPSCVDYVMHALTLPWKLLFALVPPTTYLGGWACFVASISVIGLMTAIIGDLASHFGCTIGLKDSVTAISLVALGTSLPDTFASKSAATNDEHADASIGNVTGSNAVNVFLGIGIAWTIAAFYHLANPDPITQSTAFEVSTGSLAFSVTLFCIGAVMCVFILQIRRYSGSIAGELGGPKSSKAITFMLFIGVWLIYVVLSSLEAYCIIEGF